MSKPLKYVVDHNTVEYEFWSLTYRVLRFADDKRYHDAIRRQLIADGYDINTDPDLVALLTSGDNVVVSIRPGYAEVKATGPDSLMHAILSITRTDWFADEARRRLPRHQPELRQLTAPRHPVRRL